VQSSSGREGRCAAVCQGIDGGAREDTGVGVQRAAAQWADEHVGAPG
jgi:hypothetical protein